LPQTFKEMNNSALSSSSTSSDTSTDDNDSERDLPSGASFSVSIESRETRIDSKTGNKFITYQLSITVSSNNISNTTNNWKVWHRYSEFVDFRNQLRRNNIQVTHLPPKTWQSNFVDSFLDSRQYALANWVAQLPSIFLLGSNAENLIRIFLISSNLVRKSAGSGDSSSGGGGTRSNPSTPSPARGKISNMKQGGSSGIGGLLVRKDFDEKISGGVTTDQREPEETPERLKRVVSMNNFDMLKVLGKSLYLLLF